MRYQMAYPLHSNHRQKPKRVHFLDEMRGLCVLLMVVYHGAYDLVYLFGVNIPAFHAPLLHFLQPFVAGIFVLISGIACRYSHNNLKRGGIALGLGLLLTAITFFFMREQAIYFGILHLLGSAMLVFSLLKKGLDRLHPFVGMLLCGALFAVFWGVPRGYVGLGPLRVALPGALYETGFLFPLGLAGRGFASADYFPLLPWLFLFLAGSYIGCFFVEGNMPSPLYDSHIPPLSAVGKKALLVYILHQPIVYGVLWGVFWSLKALGIWSSPAL